MDLFGVGDHGGGPTRAMLDQGLRWMQSDKVVPRSEFGTAQPYFSAVEKQIGSDSPTWNYETLAKGNTKLPTPSAGQISIPTWKDELYLEFHRGVFTTQAAHKRNMRESEEWLLNAEKYASLAWLDGRKYPDTELTDAWKHVLFNQFHDLAAGSGIGVIYQDAQKDYNQVHWATDEITSKSLDTVQAHVNTHVPAGSVPVMVINPLGWQRSGVAEAKVQMPSAVTGDISLLDAKGRVLPSQIVESDKKTNTYHLLFRAEDVPSLGYEVLHAVAGKRAAVSDVKANGSTIENAALRVTVDPQSGCITSLYDKKASFETIASGGCGNELQAFKDTPKDYDAWNIDPGTLDVAPTRLNKADSVTVTEHGPLRATIRVTRTWQSSKFVQDITLYTGSDHAVVTSDFDWH
jgi:alpha-mannosidase